MTKILLGKGVTVRQARKSVEYQGLTLRRHPRGPELAIDLAAIKASQDMGAERIRRILTHLRLWLIEAAVRELANLDAADLHKLAVEVPAESRIALQQVLNAVYLVGRRLVASELAGGDPSSFEPSLAVERIADATASRVANDVQARVSGAAAEYSQMGLDGPQMRERVALDLREGSEGYLDTAAQSAANSAVSGGRVDEAKDREGEWTSVYYSSVLDSNTCDACSAADGETGPTPESITPAPNPDCAGGANCRCIHIFTLAEEGETVD